MARSEANAVGNTTYSDLNLTYYPDKIDSRVTTNDGYNANLKGYANFQERVMAEHVNALTDAVMAIQRVLGIDPQFDMNGQANTEGTVSGRIKTVENPARHDGRYGGSGWLTSQTLVGHTHTGAAGHPSQIDLATEVKGKLAKGFLDLTSTGLTGSDLMISSSSSIKISSALNDKLSLSQGGVIKKDLDVLGQLSSRFMREWDSTNRNAGTEVSDATTMTNKALRASGTTDVRFIHTGIKNLNYGQYVVGVRLRSNSLTTTQLGYIRMYNYLGGKWVLDSSLAIKGSDFNAASEWKTFYMVCDIKGDSSNSYPIIHIGKSATSTTFTVDFDSAFIMPIHPAVFDM